MQDTASGITWPAMTGAPFPPLKGVDDGPAHPQSPQANSGARSDFDAVDNILDSVSGLIETLVQFPRRPCERDGWLRRCVLRY